MENQLQLQNEQATALCHRFNLKYTWHHRFFWEVTLEEWFVHGYVLHTDNVVSSDADYLVYQCKRITVRKQFADTLNVHNRCLVAIVYWCLNIVQLDFLADGTGKLVVDGMSRTGCDDAALDPSLYLLY